MNTSLRFFLAVAAILLVPACTLQVADDAIVDTVRVTDTLVRVETLLVRDTMIALGQAQLPEDATVPVVAPLPPAGAVSAAPSPASAGGVNAAALLRGRRLMVPVAGISPARLTDTFHEKRGARIHEATDILAPRGTPVIATDAGRIAKLFTSAGGGLTIYVADPTNQIIYYYAHLDAYQPGLREGMTVRMGDVLGRVGTTGNAPPNTPHLHFAIGEMDARRVWYHTQAIDPKPYLLVPGVARTP